MNLIIMGPQGSGKSTQAKLIAEKLNLTHISTGDIIRNLFSMKIAEGISAHKYLAEGKLVPDELISQILTRWISIKKITGGVILDGYPRTVPQARELRQGILPQGDIDLVIYLELSEKECVKRLLKRAETENRIDETPDAIRTRLHYFYRKTEPLAHFYREEKKLLEIDGDLEVKEIHENIMNQLRVRFHGDEESNKDENTPT